ncbi:MAG: hypothetical protein ACXV74_05150 [Methylobacter sp.]
MSSASTIQFLTSSDAVVFVTSWLKQNNLRLSCTANNLLAENRRSPVTDEVIESGARTRGNRHIYGKCYFIQRRSKIFYPVDQLKSWLENNVRPHCEPVTSTPPGPLREKLVRVIKLGRCAELERAIDGILEAA